MENNQFINNPLVSIIVPAYNIAEFLPLCLDSIKRQTYKNLEVLIVDDGSTDDTPSAAADYVESDSRFKLLTKQNGGQSSARNLGVKTASGSLLMFVDGDDLIADDCVDILVHSYSQNNVQMVVAVAERVDEKQGRLDFCGEHKTETMNREGILTYMLYGRPGIAPWCKLASREFWLKNPLPEGCVYEDLRTTFGFVRQCDSVAVVWGPLYGYRFRSGSTTSKKRISCKQLNDYIIAIQAMDNDLKGLDTPELQKAKICRHCNEYARVFRFLRQHTKEDKRYATLARAVVRYERKHIFQLLAMQDATKIIKLRALLIAIAPWANDFAYSIATKIVGKNLS